MKSQHSYNNTILNEEKTGPKIDNIVPYNYKKRREELNKIVKNHIAQQQQKLTQKTKLSRDKLIFC